MSAQPQGRRCKATLLFTLVLCCLRALSASAMGNPNERYLFDIPQGVAAWRLNDFGTQSGMQLLFNFEDMKGINVAAVRGEYKPFDALNLMIKGTDIRYEFVNRRTVTLTRSGPGMWQGKVVPRQREAAMSDRRSASTMLPEVRVTGSSYESVFAATGAPVLTVTRTDIDASGFVTAQGVIRTLPQVFGGGPTEDTNPSFSAEARTNAARGSGINLRGLGASSTLVLMNGLRLPGGGTQGTFVDISNLPLDAIERIDILPDNSSTVYGSDAVGGVVNFVMREGFTGRQTEAYFGSSTRDSLGERYVSQLFGMQAGRGHGLLALDFYSRGDLAASTRRQAKSDLTEFGGTNFDVTTSNPGNISVGNVSYAIPAGQDGKSLQSTSLVPGTKNLQNQWEGADVLPSQERWSAFGTWRQNLSPDITWFSDLLVGQREARGHGSGFPLPLVVPPSNAFYVAPPGVTGPLVVNYNFIDDLGPMLAVARVRSTAATTGLQFPLGAAWDGQLTASYSSERVDSWVTNQVAAKPLATALASSDRNTAFNPFGDGSHTSAETLESLRSRSDYGYRSSLKTAGLLFKGPLVKLPGGDLRLALGGEGREQSFSSELVTDTTLQPLPPAANKSRTIGAAFAELRIPIFGSSNRLPGLEELTFSAARRYEHYNDFGPDRADQLGLSWTAINGLKLRSSFSESFRPPGLLDLDESTNAYQFLTVRDPQSATGLSRVLLWLGKNRDLRAERARSWTAGLELTPAGHPDSMVALTYFHTNFENRLNSPPTPALPSALIDPSLEGLVDRNPSAQYRDEICTRSPQTPSPAADCLTRPIAAIIDARLRNSSITHTRGIDLLGRHEMRTSFGTFSFTLNGTYLLQFADAFSADSPLTDRVSTQNNPVDFKARGSVRWQRGALDMMGSINFTDGYRDTLSDPHRHVDSWTTFDLHASYALRAPKDSWLGDTTLSLGIDNVFDKDPPFLNNPIGTGYDQENGDLIGRMWSLSVRKKW